jgi:hypothetical protein
MDGVNKEVDDELLTVDLNGHNTNQVTWVMFAHLWYGTLDEAKHTLVNCIRLCDDSEI